MDESHSPQVELIQMTPNAEMLLEKAMRVCYNSFDKCDGTIECARKLVKKLIGNWHLDTLEHASSTFYIVCSRVTLAQLTRHRIASFGVESQRYVKYDEPRFIEPAKYDDGYRYFEEVLKIEHEAYQKLMQEYGWKKEDARYVLGEAWKTQLYMTMNFRQLRHFIELRSDKAAQSEIRQISDDILSIMVKRAPSVFEDLLKEEKNESEEEILAG